MLLVYKDVRDFWSLKSNPNMITLTFYERHRSAISLHAQMQFSSKYRVFDSQSDRELPLAVRFYLISIFTYGFTSFMR